MSLIHKLKVHLYSVGLSSQQIAAVGSYLRTRKDAARSIKGILTLTAQQIIDQVVVPHTLKRIEQKIIEDVNAGQYSLIQPVSEEYFFNVVVWSEHDLKEASEVIDFVCREWPGGKYQNGEYHVPGTEEDGSISFRIEDLGLDQPTIKKLFAGPDPIFANSGVWADTLPNAVYYIEIIKEGDLK